MTLGLRFWALSVLVALMAPPEISKNMTPWDFRNVLAKDFSISIQEIHSWHLGESFKKHM